MGMKLTLQIIPLLNGKDKSNMGSSFDIINFISIKIRTYETRNFPLKLCFALRKNVLMLNENFV